MSVDVHTIVLLIARPVDRALLAEFLVESGYRVVDRTPDETARAEWERMSLVLVDVRTARVLGPALLALKRERVAFVPIVVALGPSDQSLEWLRAGFDDVLRLPVSKLELAARLRVCLRYREHSVEQHRIEHSRLEEVLRQMPAGVIIADATSGAVLYENERMEQIWRRPRHAAGSIEDYATRKGFHADGVAYTPDQWPLARSIRAGEVATGEEIEIERGDGSRATVLVSSAAIRDADGSPVAGVATFVDITERKEIERALRSSEEFSRKVFESGRDAIAVLELDGRVHSLNPGGRELFEIDDPAGAAGTPWVDFWDEEYADAARAALESARAGRTEHYQGACPSRTGRRRWCDVVATPILDGEGRPERLLVVARDMTESRRSEEERERLLARAQRAREEAERANLLKDEFLATVSHELRTPLNAIIGWLHLLETGHVDAATHERAIATISRNAHAQAQIVADLLDISRIRTGKFRMDLTAVDLPLLVKDVVDTLNPAALGKRIRVRTVSDAGLSPVLGDADRLRQVIWNLLSNAVKFSHEGGSVDVRLERDDAHVEIVVRDTGQGIAPDFLPYVFDRFRQADGSATRAHGGLGLGLSIVREIVALHGGTVTASSPGKGEGATFVVRLPATTPAVAVPSATSPTVPRTRGLAPDVSGLAGRRILVVEDEPDSLDVVELILRRCGAVSQGCRSVEEALEALRDFGPDCIVADIGLPGEDGFDLIRRIRALEAGTGRSVPAVALTAFAGEKDRLRALAEGFHVHVAKPVDGAELVDAIARLVRPTT
jgi:PAS domain S-box-containing protein